MTKEGQQISCTWKDEKICLDCKIVGRIHCRFSVKKWLFFALNALPTMIIGIFGMVTIGLLTKKWWSLITYGGVVFVFWGLGLETLILCTHCPFYAEEGKTLRCLANTGLIKFWRYRPGPMNFFEKALLIVFFILMFGCPIGGTAYGVYFMAVNYTTYGLFALLGMIGITGATLLTTIQFFYILQYYFCPNCVNFSCPLNRVRKEIVDCYLQNNPVMKEAWEKTGYQLGEEATN
ncbi:MAG: hypothetical protein ACFFDI_24855 [Promethearchaeota archaeon]